MNRQPVRPDRVRCIRRGFAVIPNRFLHDGFFASLTHLERSVYLFLILAGDRNGVSYYGYERICSSVEIPVEDFLLARKALIDKDLIATDGTRCQVLSLPAQPVTPDRPLVTQDDFERDDPATIRQLIEESLQQRRR
jgi:hypothetical protein